MVVSHILNYNFKDMKLSIVIPSYKDKYNKNTVEDLLKNSELGDDLEIIVVQDGYSMPDEWIVKDPRVVYIRLGKNLGMRGAINAGVRTARGEFIARCDEHIKFSPGYDKILTDSCGPKDMITGRRYFLNPETWSIMEEKGFIDCEKLTIQDCGDGIRKFAGHNWKSRSEKFKDDNIIEAQAMQGSFWVTSKAHWDSAIIELETEGYGPLYGDSHEALFKTWKVGGRLLYDKRMWYAHKDRSFSRTHSDGTKENPANKQAGWMYSLFVWEKYWLEEIKPKWDKKCENE
jgi:glycosyltransferase involved in cell wall biosynthesis